MEDIDLNTIKFSNIESSQVENIIQKSKNVFNSNNLKWHYYQGSLFIEISSASLENIMKDSTIMINITDSSYDLIPNSLEKVKIGYIKRIIESKFQQ